MNSMTLLLFIPACFALNVVPGPNNLLSMSNAKRYGVKMACLAGIGRLIAFAAMIALAATGLATLLYTSEHLFLIIKLIGGLYLLWLAYQFWVADPHEVEWQSSSAHSPFGLAKQEFILAAGNPKAILIFTAFLPQFVDPTGHVGLQFLLLGVLFLLLECIAIAGYAFFGKVLRVWFSQPRMKQVFNRVCAGLLGSAGLGLLLTQRQG